jgi:flavorubredoxin
METMVDEIAEDVFRLSTLVPDAAPGGFTFNQFLLKADEPLLFHTGPRAMFPLVSEAISRLLPIESLRWIAFGHVEADECGAMNLFLAAAPQATVVHGVMGNLVSLNDLADREPRSVTDGEALDLGGKRLRHIDTPHVPHGWEARVLFDETSGTLLCGDLFTQTGVGPAVITDEIISASLATEELFGYTSSPTRLAATARKLAELSPTTLACMHGSSFAGDGGAALRGLADAYEDRFPRDIEES